MFRMRMTRLSALKSLESIHMHTWQFGKDFVYCVLCEIGISDSTNIACLRTLPFRVEVNMIR